MFPVLLTHSLFIKVIFSQVRPFVIFSLIYSFVECFLIVKQSFNCELSKFKEESNVRINFLTHIQSLNVYLTYVKVKIVSPTRVLREGIFTS